MVDNRYSGVWYEPPIENKCDCEGYLVIARNMLKLQDDIADLRRQLEEYIERYHHACMENDAMLDDIKSLRRQIAEVTAERELFSKQTVVIWKAVRAVQDLIDQSQGVYGLHLNGEGAPWETLRKGGQFEEWLLDFDDALESADDEAKAAQRREE